MRFLSFICLAKWLVISNASWQCFNVHPSHAVSNSDAIAELFRVTAGECLNYCISQAAQKGGSCVSVVFHRKFSTCQLYGHNGTHNGSAVVYLEDHDFYIRSSWDDQCKDMIVPAHGYRQNTLQRIVPHNSPIPKAQAIPKLPVFENSDFPSDPLIRDGIRKAPAHFETEILQEIENQLVEDDFNMDYLTTTSVTKKRTNPDVITTFRNTAHNYKCQRDETLSYFLVHGSRLTTKMLPQRLNGVDESSCLMYCSQNINAIGQNIPCYSLNYEPTNEICEMYGKQERNQSEAAVLAIDDEHTFGDKFCIKTNNHCDAETLYPVHLYKKITKNAIAQVPGLDSKLSCLGECIENKECKSVTYKNGMCVLHSVSPSEDESLLLDGSGKTMVIENGCHLASTAKVENSRTSNDTKENESEWQEWSLCQYGVKGRKMRVRQRDCEDCDENLQLEEC